MRIELRKIKPWILPLAMLTGAIFHSSIGMLQFLAPYLIFVMLLITYCKIKPHELRPAGTDWSLLSVQILGAVVLYLLLRPLDEIVAQGVMICVLCPTATAAPVITGMLGGSIARLATFSLISNIAVALVAPLLFSLIGAAGQRIGFMAEFTTIGSRVAPLILGPLLLAFLLLAFLPRVHAQIRSRQSVSFYIWALSLIIVVGNAVSFVIAEPSTQLPRMIWLALGALAVCLLQFGVGHLIGVAGGDVVSCTQGLGQKNTVLAIWMALTYLDPLSSVAPAAYVAWQNILNSAQLFFKEKQKGHAGC